MLVVTHPCEPHDFQGVGSRVLLDLLGLSAAEWLQVLVDHSPADALVTYTDLDTQENRKLELVSLQLTPEMVQFWNCMFMRVLSIVIRNHKIPAQLWRNSVLNEEDRKCGSENGDMLDVENAIKEFRKIEKLLENHHQ